MTWEYRVKCKEKVGLWHLRVKRFTNYKSQPLKANVSLHLIFLEIGREDSSLLSKKVYDASKSEKSTVKSRLRNRMLSLNHFC